MSHSTSRGPSLLWPGRRRGAGGTPPAPAAHYVGRPSDLRNRASRALVTPSSTSFAGFLPVLVRILAPSARAEEWMVPGVAHEVLQRGREGARGARVDRRGTGSPRPKPPERVGEADPDAIALRPVRAAPVVGGAVVEDDRASRHLDGSSPVGGRGQAGVVPEVAPRMEHGSTILGREVGQRPDRVDETLRARSPGTGTCSCRVGHLRHLSRADPDCLRPRQLVGGALRTEHPIEDLEDAGGHDELAAARPTWPTGSRSQRPSPWKDRPERALVQRKT